MELKTQNLGIFNVAESDIIRFPHGIPGLPQLKRFVLCSAEDLEPFKYLQSVEAPGICFLLVVPQDIVPDYDLLIDEELRRALDFEEGQHLAVYAIVTPAPVPSDSTVNLRAPLLINAERMLGCQAIQDDPRYRVRHPLAAQSRVAG